MSGKGKSSQRGAEMLASLEDGIAERLRSRLPDKEAGNLARDVTEALRMAWGGQLIYIPMDRVRRDAAICKAFTGDNHHELAEHFHMSVNSIYKILRAERERRKVRQGSLLDAG